MDRVDPHERDVANAFDAQAERFERAPVQSDAAALGRLLAAAAFPAGSDVLDAGCGPGLVAEALLAAGHRVHGVDLSARMIERARARCARFGDHARFELGSVLELPAGEAFDGSVSRFVLHHAPDPLAFVRAQVAHVRSGGVVFAADHTTDPDPSAASWHQRIERGRDRTHARNLTPGALVELLASAGLVELRLLEEPFELDFDEWFDRGSPASTKAEIRALLLAGRARGFEPAPRPDGGVTIRCTWGLARGVKR